MIRAWASARVQAAVHSPSDTIPGQGAEYPYEPCCRTPGHTNQAHARFFNPVGIRTWCRYGQADRQFHEYPRSGNVCEVRGVTVRPTTRAIPLLRHDMKFPLYRLATLWQSALTIRGNVLAHRHDAERATCLKRSRHGREEKRVRERISSMESHNHARLQSHVNRSVREPEQMVP